MCGAAAARRVPTRCPLQEQHIDVDCRLRAACGPAWATGQPRGTALGFKLRARASPAPHLAARLILDRRSRLVGGGEPLCRTGVEGGRHLQIEVVLLIWTIGRMSAEPITGQTALECAGRMLEHPRRQRRRTRSVRGGATQAAPVRSLPSRQAHGDRRMVIGASFLDPIYVRVSLVSAASHADSPELRLLLGHMGLSKPSLLMGLCKHRTTTGTLFPSC